MPPVPVPKATDVLVPVAQLDKASDYESEDWGFKSLQGYVLLLYFVNIFCASTLAGGAFLAWMPEGSKGADLRSAGHLSAWVRTPLQACSFVYFFCLELVSGCARANIFSCLHGLMDKAHPS